jgi:hypothetical protein
MQFFLSDIRIKYNRISEGFALSSFPLDGNILTAVVRVNVRQGRFMFSHVDIGEITAVVKQNWIF